MTTMREDKGWRQNIWVSHSPTEWSIRVGLAALTAVVGYYCTIFSLAQVVAKTDPALAHSLAGDDGRITAAFAATLSGPQASASDRASADKLARLALRQDSTAAIAVSTLSLNAQVRGNATSAQRLLTYAQRLSRRELKTQLLSIETAVARENIPEALKWYDITLRTTTTMEEMLFPILVSAGEDPEIRAELLKTLATKPAWAESFIKFAAGNGSDPRSTAVLFKDLHRAGVTIPESAKAGMIDALMRKDYYDEAWSYYSSIRSAVDTRRSRDPRFSDQPDPPTQFDWVPVNADGISTSIRDRSFEFTASAGTGGPLLWQKQILPPGTYRISGRSEGLEQSSKANPYWSLTCQNGQELAHFVIPNSSQNSGNFSSMVSVTSGCPVQTLTLIAQPSDAISGMSGRIDQAELVPVARHTTTSD